jgi:hypothetical protein
MPTVAPWRTYVIEPDRANQALLGHWEWLLGDGKRRLLFYNLFGDAFLADSDDRLLVLDVGFGELTDTDQKGSDIERLMASDDTREQFLQCALVDRLRKSGKGTGKNECYGFSKRPPVFGGEYEPNNLKPIALEVHHVLLSQIQEQARDLPEGAEIDGIELSDEDEDEDD